MCSATILLTGLQVGMRIASARAQAQAIAQQGAAQNKYYQYLADVNEQQALLAERTGKAQSRAIQDVQKLEGRNLKLSQAEFRSKQQAALAASGVPLSSVTAGDIDKNTVNKQALDEATLRFNADIRSFEAITSSQNRAFSLRSQGQGFRVAGRNAITAANFNARSTLLGGVASAVSPLIFSPFTSGFGVPRGIRVPFTNTVFARGTSGNISRISGLRR